MIDDLLVEVGEGILLPLLLLPVVLALGVYLIHGLRERRTGIPRESPLLRLYMRDRSWPRAAHVVPLVLLSIYCVLMIVGSAWIVDLWLKPAAEFGKYGSASVRQLRVSTIVEGGWNLPTPHRVYTIRGVVDGAIDGEVQVSPFVAQRLRVGGSIAVLPLGTGYIPREQYETGKPYLLVKGAAYSWRLLIPLAALVAGGAWCYGIRRHFLILLGRFDWSEDDSEEAEDGEEDPGEREPQ